MKNHLALLFLGVLTLGPALDWPEGWDELVYHAQLPQRWLRDGGMAVYRDLPYSGFPSLGEAVAWLVAPIEHVIAPRLILWFTWIVSLIFLQTCLRALVSAWAAQTLLCSFAFCDTVLLVSGCCYVEAILMMNLAAMLLWMVAPESLPAARWRAMAAVAVLAGGAAAVKLTAAALGLIPLLALVFGRATKALTKRECALRCAQYLCFLSIFVAPFYVRPWLATGNPLFPFFDDWFVRDLARLESSHYHHAIAGEVFGVQGFAARLMSPVLLAFHLGLFDGSFGWQSLLWFGWIAYSLWICFRRGNSPVRWESVVLITSAALLYGFWSVTTQQARFAIPAAMCVVVLVAIQLRQLQLGQAARRVYLAALMMCALIGAPWQTAAYYLGGWMTATGLLAPLVSTDEATGGEYLPLMAAIDENTPADSHLLMLFEHRGFYISRRHSLGTPFFQSQFFTPPEAFQTAERIESVLRTAGVTHVVLSVVQSGPDYAEGWSDRLPPFLSGIEAAVNRGLLQVVWESGRYKILKVVPD